MIFAIPCAIICGIIANSKGRNPIGWSIFGFFLTVIAIIVICVVSNVNEEREKDRRINRKLDEANTRIRSLQRQIAEKDSNINSRLGRQYIPETQSVVNGLRAKDR